jgi:hypothetical protein
MSSGSSQDSETRQRSRDSLRTVVLLRAVGGLAVFTLMAILGIVGLATGHYRTGLIALGIGGLAVAGIAVTWVRRRRAGERGRAI